MHNISPLKFSRYFFAVFLLVTVLPLLSLLVWSNYDLVQNMNAHQKHLLESVTGDTVALYQNRLQEEVQEVERLTDHAVRGKTLEQYGALLDANDVWRLDSPEAREFMRVHPEGTFLKRQAHKVSGSYIRDGQAVESLFVVQPDDVHSGLLIVKRVPVEALRPPGPTDMAVFSGNTTNHAAIIAKFDFHFGPEEEGRFHFFRSRSEFPHSGPPVGVVFRDSGFSEPSAPEFHPGMEPGKRKHWHGPHGPGGPCGAHPHPRCQSPLLSFFKSNCGIVEKTVHIDSVLKVPVATLRIRIAPPQGPPPGMMGGGGEQWISALILLTGLLSSLLAGNYIQRNFIAPLMQLSHTTQQVQEGDLSVRIATETIKQPDVRKTLESFNKMLDELLDKEKLRHSFVSNLTHDLRTPLIAQTRSLELLCKEFQERHLTEQEKLAQGIVKNNEHLLTMVNQLLETYQTEAGMFMLELQRDSLPKLVTHCFEQLSTLAAERNIELTQDFSSDFPELMMDAHYLKRVFINLIANAIQNIPKGSHVQVLGKRITPESVEIRVRDNGHGIPEEEQKQVFDRYYAGTGDTRKLGSGLGLYICKVLVTAHQGNIIVESVPGGGTDFVIQLPVEARGTV